MADRVFVATDKRGVQYRDMAGRRSMAFNNGVSLKDPDIDSLFLPKRTAEGKIVEENGEPVMVLRYGFKEITAARGRPAKSAEKILKDQAKNRRAEAKDIADALG